MPGRMLACLVFLALSGCMIIEEGGRSSLGSQRDPGKALRANIDMAHLYMQRGDMAQAERKLKKAETFDDGDPGVLTARGIFFMLEDQPDKAEMYFQDAIYEDPEFSMAYYNYAVLLMGQERYADATVQLEAVTGHAGYVNRAKAYKLLGDVYLKQKRLDDARKAYNRALRTRGNSPDTLLGMAELHLLTNDIKAAKAYLDEYERVSPTPAAEQLWLGIRIQRQWGDRDRLASYELALRKLFSNSSQFREYEKTLSR